MSSTRAWPEHARSLMASVAARRWLLALLVISGFVLFYHLGTPALFEPDEGRNAEKAREILVTHDWVTPHQDFLPVLDKPIFFYWLVALSYKVFGVSEWAARLPSALAAAGCLLLIYLLIKYAVGVWEGLWTALILVTSVEFFLLARIVIFDMSLTFFTTLALCCFYWGLHADSTTRRRVLYLAMYAAMGAATLVKGLEGVVVPGMIIGSFVVLARRWPAVRDFDLFAGVPLFLVIVLPSYVLAELRNPGYLRYFFWEEHFVRFLTPHFQRSEPWYYFLFVLAIGFLPWTFLLPRLVLTQWNKRGDELTLFLMLWAILPLLFFSLSHSKLPHYILPLYPPLAALTGITFAKMISDKPRAKYGELFLPFYVVALLIALLGAGAIRPSLLPKDVGRHFIDAAPLLFGGLAVVSGAVVALIFGKRAGYFRRAGYVYVFYCIALIPLFVVFIHVMTAVSIFRSAKPVAEALSPVIPANDQLVVYDADFEGLPFYLKINRPIWIVLSSKHPRQIIGSFYLAEHPPPTQGYGKILLTLDEFAEEWDSDRPLSVITTRERLRRFVKPDRTPPRELGTFDKYVLVRNR